MIKKVILLLFLLTLPTLFLQNCDCTEPNSRAKITLTALDASSTEVWLKLKTANVKLPTEVTITESDTLINNYTLTKNDTTLFIENLLPTQPLWIENP